ncbi:sensor histidine kinase [Amycolatopsis sp. cg5]|uniref:sensor histidine kinase n=1 Tax=Amycolatopsis sp. cg5 TaxID=3238802 RepID=UPI0035239BB4
MRDKSGALARQSMLVAAVCLVADVGQFLIRGPALTSGWQVWVVLIGTIVADAALAGPARLSGWVALGHALLVACGPILLCSCSGQTVGNNAGILIAGYRAGAWLSTIPAWLSLAAMCGGLLVGSLTGTGKWSHEWRMVSIGLLTSGVLPWLVGRYTTARRAYIAELERKAEQRRQDEAEAVRRAVAEERTAIARDLHDVISHHVSAIGVHAGAARLGLPAADSPVRRSLSAVESSSRAAMVDLRRLLDLLHRKETESGQRQPGLDNLDELLDGVRAANLPARLTTIGEPRDLPSSLDVALYRIVQEALTNALRHGDGGTVDVAIEYRQIEVILSITNDSTHVARGGANEFQHRGLAGIRQRVALFGGQVTYGPLPGENRWQVRVIFPLEQS